MIGDVNTRSLIEGIIDASHENVIKLNSQEDLPAIIKKIANEGDVVMCLGAGDITDLANKLPGLLKNISDTSDGDCQSDLPKDSDLKTPNVMFL